MPPNLSPKQIAANKIAGFDGKAANQFADPEFRVGMPPNLSPKQIAAI